MSTVNKAPTSTRPHRRPPPPNIVPHLALVGALASRIARATRLDLCALDADDLRAIGSEALLEAARRYDPRLGAAFPTFAYRRVRGAMIDAIRSHGPYHGRSDKHEHRIAFLSLDADDTPALDIPDRAPCPDEAYQTRTDIARLRDAIGRLPPKERRLIQAYYLRERTLDQVGAAIGTSRSWTCRLLQRALEHLRAQFDPAR